MIVKNTSKRTSINNVGLSSNLLSNAIGLMFRKNGRLLLRMRREGFPAIWMPFMRFSIDTAFIDSYKKVVDIRKNVRPLSLDPRTWRLYVPRQRCRYVLEVEAGLLAKKKFRPGDRLDF